MVKIALTGIKPSGTPHIGNYSGMIKSVLELVQRCLALYFIGDYHALTTERDSEELNRQVYEVAATWLALGLDPEACNLFSLYRYFAPYEAVKETRMVYLKGGARYSDIKKELIELLLEKFKKGRRSYEALLRDKPAIERILKQGAVTARSIAESMLTKVRRKIGIDQTDLYFSKKMNTWFISI